MAMYFEAFQNTGKEIKTEGYVYHGKTEINMSSIYTKLIQEAGRYCDFYASDLLFDIYKIHKIIQSGESGTVYIGFRDSGVDGNQYISVKEPIEIGSEYHAIYCVEIKQTEDDYYERKIIVTLNKVWYSSIKYSQLQLTKGGN